MQNKVEQKTKPPKRIKKMKNKSELKIKKKKQKISKNECKTTRAVQGMLERSYTASVDKTKSNKS